MEIGPGAGYPLRTGFATLAKKFAKEKRLLRLARALICRYRTPAEPQQFDEKTL
jgi:hypothetical protein